MSVAVLSAIENAAETLMPDTIKTGTTLIEEGTLLPESLQFEGEPWTSFYTAGGIIRELRKASGKQSKYGSGCKRLIRTKRLITTITRATSAACRRMTQMWVTGLVGAPECGDMKRRRYQDAIRKKLWLGNCQLFARHRVGQGQDLEEALAIKNTNIVRELSLLPCNPARCKKILQNWREATPGG